ncbi:hypothetical protein F5I97DRAFT_1938180 [Phlebopus sp. FC_14]|nr:hypothetical protein F5I97DRAFT_1938180 [Phlebopus sp. FC_14]
MDPAYLNKKIVDLNDAELIALGFMGENVAPGVKSVIDGVKADPDNLGSVTCFMVDCLRRKAAVQSRSQDATQPPDSPISPTSPTLSGAEILFSQLSIDSDAHIVVAPDLIPKYEINIYYHGVSGDPPKLLWRSDIETNPFPLPPPGTNVFKIPTKTAHGVFKTPLNAVWDTVAPQILVSMKAHGLQHSALKTARFLTVEDGKDETFGPVVVWIAVRPNTTNAGAVRDATPDILNILADAQITDVVVEWYEGLVTSLAKFGHNHPFNTGLGIPIARQSEGTLSFLFKEMKTSSGEPSDRIPGLTNKHVASLNTTTEFDDADPQHILNTPEGNTTALRRRKTALEEKNEDNVALQALFAEVTADWQDTNGRRFGVVDYAPHISVRVDDRPYTRDIATFVVDGEKLENFESNIVDFGAFRSETVREGRRIPDNLQLTIRAALSRRLVMNPDTEDKNGEPLYIVAKYGNMTKLTLGRYSGMDTYTCHDIGLESREVAVYNYSKTLGDFCDHGDLGSLIFTGDGNALAMLHSRIPRGLHNHILVKYPNAEFYGMAYTLD